MLELLADSFLLHVCPLSLNNINKKKLLERANLGHGSQFMASDQATPVKHNY
jgi:hypothetical protein